MKWTQISKFLYKVKNKKKGKYIAKKFLMIEKWSMLLGSKVWQLKWFKFAIHIVLA